MKVSLFVLIIILVLALAGCRASKPEATPEPTTAPTEALDSAPVDEPAPAVSATVTTPEVTASGLPPAAIANDEGGPKRLLGTFEYTDFAIPVTLRDPAPALLDMVNVVRGDSTQFAPVESQILGYMTSPVAPSPLHFAVDLPAVPTGTLLDVDNDGEEGTGVQIFRIDMGANINGGSHQEQLDQAGGLSSYLTDPVSGQITEGSLLVYAPDGEQGFPSGFGADGRLFTADDPAVRLPQGYTVVHFGPDGFTFDRAEEAEINILETAESSSPDFSKQGIVESFNSLIDHLAERYSFTELRGLDWEAIRAEYLPQVEEAEKIAGQDANAGGAVYATILHQLAQSVRDAHVVAVVTDPAYLDAARLADMMQKQPIAANVGANTVELSDGRIIVTDVIAGSPADQAGWTFGTEIIAVNGVAVADRLPTVIYNEHTGTDEGQRLFQVSNLLKFPALEGTGADATVTIDAILPGAAAAQSFTMPPGAYTLPDRLASPKHPMPIQYQINPTWGYLTWNGFVEPEVNMAVLRQFLTEVKQNPGLNGVILDLRGNGGGWDLLYLTMASYFFDANHPVSMHWIDQDSYDPVKGDFVREAADEYLLSAPQADLYYGGPVVILVDQNCASSCEFFSQFMQSNGRATVVGQHASAGAGAPINRVSMPSGITFQYTKGRSYFANTDELNLEAKGVVPDVRVPVTVETEAAILKGDDPVLAAGLSALDDLVGKAMLTSFKLAPLPADATKDFAALYPEGWTLTPADGKIAFVGPGPLYNFVLNSPSADGVEGILAQLGVADPKSALVDTRQANGLEWSIYSVPQANDVVYRLAAAQANGLNYIISMAAPKSTVEEMTQGLLYPVVDSFVPAAGN